MQKRNVHIIKININVWRGFFLSPLCSPVRITNIFYQIVARGWCALFIFILSPICAMIHASRARSIGQATKQPSTHVFKLHLQQFNWIRFFSISLATQSELTKLNKTLCKTKKKLVEHQFPWWTCIYIFMAGILHFGRCGNSILNVAIDINFDMTQKALKCFYCADACV